MYAAAIYKNAKNSGLLLFTEVNSLQYTKFWSAI